GEGLQQCDLLVVKGNRLQATKGDGADSFAFSPQRNSQDAPVAHSARMFLPLGVLVSLWRQQVGNLQCLSVKHAAAGNEFSADRPFVQTDRDRSVMRVVVQIVANSQVHACIVGVAKLASVLDDRLQGKIDVGRRGGDHAEDVAAGGLVGEGV